MKKTIKILLADNYTLTRKGISKLISEQDHLFVIGEASNGDELVKCYFNILPDVVISDVSMPIKCGFQAMTEIQKKDPATKFLFLTFQKELSFIHEAYELGGKGFLNKSVLEGELFLAIEKIINGDKYFPSIYDKIKIQCDGKSSYKMRNKYFSPTKFSYREIQVLSYIGEGYQSSEIAEKIGIGKRTVDMYRSEIMQKLQCTSTAQLMAYSVIFALKRKNYIDNFDLMSFPALYSVLKGSSFFNN